MRLSGTPLVIVMSCVMVLDHLGLGVLPALQPVLIDEWQMSATEAGWVNGIFAVGYMLGVIMVVPFTDRMDARTIFLAANTLWFFSIIGFALWAEGFTSASVLRFIGGFAFAGTYMPGLKLMTDRLGRDDTSRAIAWYTASFGIGAALSFSLSGIINNALGWQWAFVILGFGSLAATALIWITTQHQAPLKSVERRRFLNISAVLGNRPALAYILAYTLHTWELITIGAWAVTFLAFAASLQPAGSIGVDVTLFGALVSLVAMPASIFGNEIARRFGRRQTVSILMVMSALFGCLVGFTAAMPFWVVVLALLIYSALTAADSASITAGTVKHAVPELYGATMTLHSFIGFTGGFLGPLTFGYVLDTAGGKDSVEGWGMAFAVVALTTLLGPLILRTLLRGVPQHPSAD
ncbi:MAG: MFS transporter [Alphaproteobacteria bacterium]|nr:MFS transporter [Alphaproteobacteria bacterium]MBT5161194.1 MFS transporter [Alphaproteobacteria bacterium]